MVFASGDGSGREVLMGFLGVPLVFLGVPLVNGGSDRGFGGINGISR